MRILLTCLFTGIITTLSLTNCTKNHQPGHYVKGPKYSLFKKKGHLICASRFWHDGGTGTSYEPAHNTESYRALNENDFKFTTQSPLSTFSIDVDNASYSNIRRFINKNEKPADGAVRIEEMINYFNYDYPQPLDEHPFSVSTEYSNCPWNKKHQLLHIGLQGKAIDKSQMPDNNLVFLIDVSGSMSNDIAMLKKSLQMLTNEMRSNDRIAIVVYAGAAGVVLPSTSGTNKSKILDALENLETGGSTAGGEGIKLAYKIAKENFLQEGNNRIILATDGDFNVGESSDAAMEKLITQKREEGIFLTVLGFGSGNYKDSKMETLADKGNGNYSYIDNLLEAKKVLVSEMGGTLLTIAKDVKLQLEFNPKSVKAYRLIGYENRQLNAEDFNDDKKDAGELGAGHTVTALYEIILADDSTAITNSVDPLKYQDVIVTKEANKNELLTLKLRYKKPKGHKSTLITHTVKNKSIQFDKSSENFKFSSAVAAFGMTLQASEYQTDMSLDDIVSLAKSSTGDDYEGYRHEFIQLVKKYTLM